MGISPNLASRTKIWYFQVSPLSIAAPWKVEKFWCTRITENQFDCNKIANCLRTVCSDQFESPPHLRQNRHFKTIPCDLQCPCKLWRWKGDQPTRSSGSWHAVQPLSTCSHCTSCTEPSTPHKIEVYPDTYFGYSVPMPDMESPLCLNLT